MNAINLFIISCIASFFVILKIRSLKSQGKNKQIRYYLLTSSLEFLIPFVFVMFAYTILITVVNNYWESISLQSLITLEKHIETIKSYAKWKLSKEMIFLIFLGIYALGILRGISLNKRRKLYSGIDTINKWTKRLYVVVVLFGSFTILGTQLGEPSNELRLRIKSIREGYADIHKRAIVAFTDEIIPEIYTKSYNVFLYKYQSVLKLPGKIDSVANELHKQYSIAQHKYGIKSHKTESILNRIEIHHNAVSSMDSIIKVPNNLVVPTKKISIHNPNKINYAVLYKA